MKTIWPAFGFGCLLLAGAAAAVPAGAQVARLTPVSLGLQSSSISSIEVAQAAHAGGVGQAAAMADSEPA